MFKFIFWTYLTNIFHAWKVKRMIPICLSGCIAVMLYCPTERALAAERQGMAELGSGSYNSWNRFLNFGIDVINSEVKSNFGINVFEFCINSISEFLGCRKIIFCGIDKNTNKGCKEEANSPMRPDWEREKKIDEFFRHFFYLFLIGALIGYLLS